MVDGTKVNEAGDAIVIKLVSPYECLTQINGYEDETIGEDTQNYFCRYFRWSTDNKNFSEFMPLTDIALQNLVLNPANDFWIEYKYEACELDTGHELEFVSIGLEAETEAGIVEQVVQTVCCEDPWDNNGVPNLTVCDNCGDNLFNPYDLGPANNMYNQLGNLVNDIFGHCVKYYKVDPKIRTEDTILGEYTLHSVTAVEEIKIMVPDNEFPTEEIQFNAVDGMGFEGFEVHMMYQPFHEAFGARTMPKERDYVYIPRIDKMFQVNSVSLADEYNNQYTYWRVKLTKWEDRENVSWADSLSVEEQELKDLVVSVDDVFGETKQDEYEQVTKPQQYKTIGTEANDFVRSDLNVDLLITDYNLNNNWTIVSKHYYDLSQVDNTTLAVKYRLPNKIETSDNRAFTFWFKWVPEVTDGPKIKLKTITDIVDNTGYAQITTSQKHRYDVGDTIDLTGTGMYDGLRRVKEIIDINNFTINETFDTAVVLTSPRSLFKEIAIPIYGYNQEGGNDGMYFKIMNGNIVVKINDTTYLYDISNELDKFDTDKWYSVVYSLNNEFNQLALYLYELDKPLQNTRPQAQDTTLELKFSEVKTISAPITIDSNDSWMLLGGPVYLTNFRIFETAIDEEQHSAVLNQFVVRDTQMALLVDNAQPQQRMLKLTNPR